MTGDRRSRQQGSVSTAKNNFLQPASQPQTYCEPRQVTSPPSVSVPSSVIGAWIQGRPSREGLRLCAAHQEGSTDGGSDHRHQICDAGNRNLHCGLLNCTACQGICTWRGKKRLTLILSSNVYISHSIQYYAQKGLQR